MMLPFSRLFLALMFCHTLWIGKCFLTCITASAFFLMLSHIFRMVKFLATGLAGDVRSDTCSFVSSGIAYIARDLTTFRMFRTSRLSLKPFNVSNRLLIPIRLAVVVVSHTCEVMKCFFIHYKTAESPKCISCV